jgi:excinuclease UvrABC nuclease subunit
MGLLGSLLKAIADSKETEKVSLKVAAEKAPDTMGCYKVFLVGELKYVGKSKFGLRKRFAEFNNGTILYSAQEKKIHRNREHIEVGWIALRSLEDCTRVEKQWIAKYKPEWNKD